LRRALSLSPLPPLAGLVGDLRAAVPSDSLACRPSAALDHAVRTFSELLPGGDFTAIRAAHRRLEFSSLP